MNIIYIIWSFGFGLLHTFMPCEDKTIFALYTFGVSRDSKESFNILSFYGIGLLCANMIIGSIVSISGTLLFAGIDPITLNGFAALSIIISGIYLMIQSFRKEYKPHSEQNKEITETFQMRQGRFRKRTAFLLGLLAGIPPCVFEIIIYNMAGISQGIDGIVIVLSFAIGTWIGLYGLGILGLGTWRVVHNRIETQTSSNTSENTVLETSNDDENSASKKIEFIGAMTLIALGIFLMIIVLLGVDIFYLVREAIPPEP
ncbi:MAG: sulfite exporter TauE/SafE family protein [archaeon]|nr:sulfite exporter TauE/SafE family protein [archaeon]